ncbi:MAG TPA: LLM class flavin-dependent oxidoreductase [Acidimicrobiales bacterium]|nr:LLM class flavin-dependent oxidoreductase [Acidimicrobiales bacterium]
MPVISCSWGSVPTLRAKRWGCRYGAHLGRPVRAVTECRPLHERPRRPQAWARTVLVRSSVPPMPSSGRPTICAPRRRLGRCPGRVGPRGHQWHSQGRNPLVAGVSGRGSERCSISPLAGAVPAAPRHLPLPPRPGLGVGWRSTDYQLTGRDFGDRGRRFDQQLRDLHKAWAGEPLEAGTRPVGPPPVQRPGVPLILGGTAEGSIRRVVEFGSGWTAGGLPPDAVAGLVERVQSAWADSSRDGRAKIVALAYFSLGDTAEDSRRNLLDYYQLMGSETAGMIADSALRSVDSLTAAVDAYSQAGVDELILDPTVLDPGQVDLLAEAVL